MQQCFLQFTSDNIFPILVHSFSTYIFSGDFFSNLSLSRRGLGEMALAGSYGSPIFNILLGLGLCFMYVCATSYPVPYAIKLDIASYVSLAFVFLSLLSTLVYVPNNQYKYDRPLGIYLIALYVVYTLTQTILALVGAQWLKIVTV